MPAQLDGELGRLKAPARQGLIAPAFLIDKAINQMTMSVKGAREGGGLVESLERRTKDIPGDWADRARAIAQQKVAPALERQLAELDGPARHARRWTPACGRARTATNIYRWALRASTTTTMTPTRSTRWASTRLPSCTAGWTPILKSLGYTKGTVGARMTALAKDPRYKFTEGDKGRAEIMAFIQERLTIIRAQLPRAFRTLVRGNLEVKRLPPEEEPGAPGAYGGAGSIDGTIPGKFWINLRTTDLHRKYDLPDLAHHEAIPGHVWQGEYSNQLPLIRTMLAFNAYSEGWALYAEQLADELGVYDDFEVGRLGYLQSLAFRACRLVVDTGLHAKRWTREQGVRFFVEINGSKPEEVASEVDRYCSWPGQACGYKVGHSEIVRQRDRAQAALGAALRPARLQRRRGQGRQRPDGRARQERRRIYRDGDRLRPAPPIRADPLRASAARSTGSGTAPMREDAVVERLLVELRAERRLRFRRAAGGSSARRACRTSAWPGQLM